MLGPGLMLVVSDYATHRWGERPSVEHTIIRTRFPAQFLSNQKNLGRGRGITNINTMFIKCTVVKSDGCTSY